MNSLFDGFILGLVQGATEFIPVSSTGHLIVIRDALKIEIARSLAFDALLHIATALAVLVYFRRDAVLLARELWMALRGAGEGGERTLLQALALGTIPAVVLGMILEGFIDEHLRSSGVVALALILGSMLFIVAEKFARKNSVLSASKGLRLGFFQALALIPGISRSGAVISGGLLLGLTRESATRFAFLLSFPIIFGAGLYEALTLGTEGFETIGAPIITGAITAFGSGLFAIHWTLWFLKKHTLVPFVIYRLVLAMFVLLYL